MGKTLSVDPRLRAPTGSELSEIGDVTVSFEIPPCSPDDVPFPLVGGDSGFCGVDCLGDCDPVDSGDNPCRTSAVDSSRVDFAAAVSFDPDWFADIVVTKLKRVCRLWSAVFLKS